MRGENIFAKTHLARVAAHPGDAVQPDQRQRGIGAQFGFIVISGKERGVQRHEDDTAKRAIGVRDAPGQRDQPFARGFALNGQSHHQLIYRFGRVKAEVLPV